LAREGNFHSVILNPARTTAVVADHGTFDRFAPVRSAKFKKGHDPIIDARLDQEIIEAL